MVPSQAARRHGRQEASGTYPMLHTSASGPEIGLPGRLPPAVSDVRPAGAGLWSHPRRPGRSRLEVPSQEARRPGRGKSSYLVLRHSASGPEIGFPKRNFCRIFIRKASESALRANACRRVLS